MWLTHNSAVHCTIDMSDDIMISVHGLANTTLLGEQAWQHVAYALYIWTVPHADCQMMTCRLGLHLTAVSCTSHTRHV